MGEQYDLIIEPARSIGRYWHDLWSYRGLFIFLAWRDILVRYKQTVIGIAWSVLRPLLTMVVLVVVFGKLAQFPSDGAPYPILVLAAMLPWQFFANGVTESSGSLVTNSGMLSKVYFPRLIFPTSSVVVSFVDFLISFGILLVMMIIYGCHFSVRLLAIPGFLFLALMTTLGTGYWLSALNVKYRDFRHVVPFIVQLGLYISPVGFLSSVVPEKWRMLYSINPLVGVIDGFRWAILGKGFNLYLPGIALSAVLCIVVFATGLIFFRRTERFFADLI